MVELIHITLGFSSLISGLFVLLIQKGNHKHKLIGRAYFLSMLGLNLTSFGIYKLFDGWGFFHWMAIASLIPLIAGYIAIRYKKINAHYYFMCWSYIGLLCATISEIFVHVPMAKSLLNTVAHIDTIFMVCLIGFGFYFLPRKESIHVRKA
ncbi:DUF2306 domain-containing protein [Catenovulum maritimum]|uniref:DUF2306 domain-containing protein n=1 Tax=Catenovulum maritimum TaxID=1513271 RepID=A0A0J8GU33_9ALTE|nr:DUF2306 domain-containing protein [Catenovulum maritimum]KMT64824.1 hypothetical protein XM47_12300 [Catenovulum maritimum]